VGAVFQFSSRVVESMFEYWVSFCGTDVGADGAGTCLGLVDHRRWERDFVAELLSSTLLILTLLLRYIINLPKYFKFKLF